MTLDSAKARYGVGDPNHHEWLLAQAQLGILDVERYRLEREQVRLRALLNELRARPPSEPIELFATPVRFGEAPETRDVDTERRPELVSLTASLRSAEHRMRASKFAFAPDLFVQGMARQSVAGRQNPSMFGAMFGITLPLFWFDKQARQLAAAERDAEAARLELDATRRRLESERTAQSQDLDSALRVVVLYDEAIMPQTQLALASARSSYASQRLSVSALLDVMRVSEQQALEYFAAKIDVELAKANLAHLLTAPPALRLAPATPTLFGPAMPSMGAMPPTPSGMGRGMGSPLPKTGGSDAQSPSNKPMGGM
ncbi:MAG: TolC family protein [Deltaproteobacteria bacterium]|nr:TolC family protein [Deltaproteobacteria bacterium]